MKKIAALLCLVLLAASARAIELSLEENRGDRGSVGYVDMLRLFADSPDAQRAKENFEELVRQAEERVNLRKAELLKLHQELDATRADRDALSASMQAAAAALAAAPRPVAIATAAPAALPPAQPVPPAVVAASTAAAPGAVSVSTGAARPRPEIALPGMAPTEASPLARPGAAVAVSSAAPASVVTSTGMAAAAALFPGAGPAPEIARVPAGPTPVQRLLEFDGKIIRIQGEIADKEAALTHEHEDADHGLLDVESRKTDQVLARLYRAVSEVSRREGVSVVVDKSTILYGQPAVDLTDKVLKYLKETSQP